MTNLQPTTSAFGRRQVSCAQIRAQIAVQQARTTPAPGPGAVHKWTLLRTLSEIRDGLGVSDRALSVLSALLSFHPETALTVDADLVVFPSNKSLSLRANGMSEPTLRRHISALVEAGLIIRRDSPNGKRFARRGEDGGQAFGFDLAPLVARAGEFERRVDELRSEQRRVRLLKERINLLRRDLTKRIAFALDEGLAGPWDSLRQAFLKLCTPLRQLRESADLVTVATGLETLQGRATTALTAAFACDKSSGDDAQIERHITKSTPQQITDFEHASKEVEDDARPHPAKAVPSGDASTPQLPLAIVLDACPDIRDYDFSDQPEPGWPAFLKLAATVRPMLGISPDAWRDAVETLGEKSAAAAVAFILQRSEHSSEATRHSGPDGKETITVNGSPAIRSPGGYLRALTEKGRREPFSLWGAVLGHLAQRAKAGRAHVSR